MVILGGQVPYLSPVLSSYNTSTVPTGLVSVTLSSHISHDKATGVKMHVHAHAENIMHGQV